MEERKLITGSDLAKTRIPLKGHVHLGFKMVKCKKCATVKKLKEVEGAGKCPKCGFTYPTDARGIAFYTQATNHFVLPEKAADLYGAAPTQIHIALPSNDPNTIFHSKYAVYNNRVCFCRRQMYPVESDIASRIVPTYQIMDEKNKVLGETLDKEDADKKAKIKKGLKVMIAYQMRKDIPCPKENCEYFKKGTCKFMTTFDFLFSRVPQLGLAAWRIDTGSLNSFKNLKAGLKMIQGLFGRLSGPEFILDLVGEEKLVKGKFKKIVYLLQLSYESALKEILDARSRKMFPAAATSAVLLPAPAESEVVIDVSPEQEYPEDIVSEHIEDGEVIVETPTTITPAGAVASASETGAGGPGNAGTAIDKEKILTELKSIIQDEKNDIGLEEDINPIYKKIGVPKGTLVSKVPVDKLPLLLEEVKKLVKKTAEEKPGKNRKLF
ncbi:MAG: hypothetical protein WC976_05880 [Caldisericia bacterium]